VSARNTEQLRQAAIQGCREMADVYKEIEREYHPLEEEVERLGTQTEMDCSFSLWQLSEQTESQMMSYVLRTAGRVILIDGGTPGDAPYLRSFLADHGSRVDAWFITHPHYDHVGALTEILAYPNGLEVGDIYGSLPDEDWARETDPAFCDGLLKLNRALRESGRSVTEVEPGWETEIDGLRVEILGVRNPEIVAGTMNNSSVVIRMSDRSRSVLFLGDLGPEAGEKLLRTEFAGRLPSDCVQMAHHGQSGVSEEFYRLVNPSVCTWPTPIWLWENRVPDGSPPGSGPWKTFETREWMDRLGIRQHFVTGLHGSRKIEM
jgi:beta-lactamase superfamily II metal-dependent hydrolase